VTCVLDASVAAKWFLPRAHETLTEEALRLLEGYSKGDTRFLVPDLFWPEFGNILWKAVRLGRISRQSAEAAVVAIGQRKIQQRQLHRC
jgi:predicted nucleic acid-binding protein